MMLASMTARAVHYITVHYNVLSGHHGGFAQHSYRLPVTAATRLLLTPHTGWCGAAKYVSLMRAEAAAKPYHTWHDCVAGTAMQQFQ